MLPFRRERNADPERRLLEFIESGRVDNDVPNVAMAMPFVRFVLAALKTFKVTAHRVCPAFAFVRGTDGLASTDARKHGKHAEGQHSQPARDGGAVL